MYNKISLMGRLTHNPELAKTPEGIPVLSFRIAVDRNYREKSKERKADFFNIVVRRANAEFIAKNFSKGKIILVEGELHNRDYIDKAKVKRFITEIVADKVHYIDESKMLVEYSSTEAGV